MSTRAVQRTRSDRWPSSVTTCSALSYLLSTNDPSLSMVRVPMPTLVVRLGGGVGAQFVTAQPLSPTPRPYDRLPREPTPAEPEDHFARFDAVELPVQLQPEEQSDGIALEEEPDGVEPKEAARVETKEAAHTGMHVSAWAGSEEKPQTPSNQIELIIDSLPRHQLTEPIPIFIDRLGDSVFTASMRNVAIAATGNSVGEALLFLKEQIETTFDELNRQLAHLTSDQKETLQILHTYIPPEVKKRRWL